MNYLISEPYLIFYLSFWLLIEYQTIGKYLTLNPFESVPSIISFPSWLKTMTLLLSNMFITYALFIGIIISSFFADHWYLPFLALLIGWIIGYILMTTKILKSIIGYKLLAIIGPLWIIGMIYFFVNI